MWAISTNIQQAAYFEREQMNEIEGQRGNKFDNCGNYNVLRSFDNDKDEEKFGVFAIRSAWDKAGNKNWKIIVVKDGKRKWITEFEIDCASPVFFFISQGKLHKLKRNDRFSTVKSVPIEVLNIFYSVTDDVIRIIGHFCGY